MEIKLCSKESFLAGSSEYQRYRQQMEMKKSVYIMTMIIGLFLGALGIALPLIIQFSIFIFMPGCLCFAVSLLIPLQVHRISLQLQKTGNEMYRQYYQDCMKQQMQEVVPIS